jgi:hypothetical protein
MNWKEFERKRGGVLAEMRTEHLPNRVLRHYRYTSLIGTSVRICHTSGRLMYQHFQLALQLSQETVKILQFFLGYVTVYIRSRLQRFRTNLLPLSSEQPSTSCHKLENYSHDTVTDLINALSGNST